METPETASSLLAKVAEHWEFIAVIGGAIGIIWGYIKFLHGKWKALLVWLRNAAAAPTAILEIKQDLLFGNGISLKQAVQKLDGNLNELKRMLNSETKWRRSILDSLDVPIFEADKDGRFMWANSTLLELAESEMSQVMGNNWRNFVAGPDRKTVFDGWEEAVKDAADYRVKFRLAVEGEQWIAFDAVCNKDDFGNVLGFVGKLRSIDDPRIHSTNG